MSNLKFKEGCSPQTLEQMLKGELGISDVKEIQGAMSGGKWPFSISPQQLWSKIQDQFEGQINPMDLMNVFTKGEMPQVGGDGNVKKGLKQKMMEKYLKRKMEKMKKEMDEGQSSGW